ncbi:prenyltransferase [bacterium]|nr:prenyltransferase [bacterium]
MVTQSMSQEAPVSLVAAWLRAIGLFRGFLIVSLIPYSIGVMVAWKIAGRLDALAFGVALAGVWLVHAGANLLNDYYDHLSGTDDQNDVRTPFSGGTRVIQDELLSARAIRNAGWLAFVAAAPVFAYLAQLRGPMVLGYAAAGATAGIFYTARPVGLAYRGLGEVTIGVVFGPLLAAFGAYVQMGRVPAEALASGVVLGLWSAAIITVNEVPDFAADEEAGKNNLVVRLGPDRGLLLWTLLLWAAVAAIFGFVLAGMLPKRAIVALLVAFPVVILTRNPRDRLVEIEDLVAACRYTILSYIGLWLLLLAGLFFARTL